jgi:hypothetical protein
MNEHPKTENISLSVVENADDTDAIIDNPNDHTLDDNHLTKVKDVDGYTQPIINADKNQQILASLLYHINQRKLKQKINNEKKRISNEELATIIEQNKKRVCTIIKGNKPKRIIETIKPSVVPIIKPDVNPIVIPSVIPILKPIPFVKPLIRPPDLDSTISPWVSSSIFPDIKPNGIKNRSFDLRESFDIPDFWLSKEAKESNGIQNVNRIIEPQNTNNAELVLINFEDDTFRPVIKINEKYINIIKKWYDTCNQLIDIEDTNIIIPKEINIVDISMILFKNMNYKHKDTFINEYVPRMLNYIILQSKIFVIERLMSISVLTTTAKVSIKKTQTLDDLGIKIPHNIDYKDEYFYTKDKKICNYSVKKDLKGETKISASTENMDLQHALNNTEISKIEDKFSVIQYINDDGLTAYNDDVYGGGNYFSLEEIKIKKCEKVKEDLTKFKLIIVLINVINPLFFQTVTVIDPELDTLTSIFEYPEYGFIELFSIKTDNDEIEFFINKHYNGNIFDNSTEINESLVSTSQFIEFSNNKLNNNKQLLEEEKSVKYYLNTFYNITNDIDNKIKAKVLYDILTKEKLCVIDKTKMAGFKNRLSNYLKELNLQKKRYSDGYYYYGIVKKTLVKENKKEFRDITDIIEERNNLFGEMTGEGFYTLLEQNDS